MKEETKDNLKIGAWIVACVFGVLVNMELASLFLIIPGVLVMIWRKLTGRTAYPDYPPDKPQNEQN